MKFPTIAVAIFGLVLTAVQPALAIPAENVLNTRGVTNSDDDMLNIRGRPPIPGCKDSEGYYLCNAVGLLGCFSPGNSGNQACQGGVGKRCREFLPFFFLFHFFLRLFFFSFFFSLLNICNANPYQTLDKQFCN